MLIARNIPIVLCCSLLLFARPASAQQIDAATFALVVPERRDGAAPPPLPELPPAAAHVTPLTLRINIQIKQSGAPLEIIKRTVSRTAEAIHIQESNGGEWFLAQNSVDPRRVSGQYVDHRTRSIVLYPETDLRRYLNLRGWADALTLGLDLDVLRALKPTGKNRTLASIPFARYDGAYHTAAWWNEEYLLASAFERTSESGSAKYAVEELQKGVDSALLREPIIRYPGYHMVEVADWLEDH